MAWRIKVLALKPEGLSLSLRTPRVEQEGVSWELSSHVAPMPVTLKI